MEQRHIIENEFRHVHITKGSHQHNIFWHFSISTLKLTGHDQHRLQGTKLEVIMVLL